MSTETDIIKDIRALIIAEVTGVGVYDSWAQSADAMPYVVFGPIQRVRFNAKNWRSSIYMVRLHLWNRDNRGSIATRNYSDEIITALDNIDLPTTDLRAYFSDSIDVRDNEDESIYQTVLSFEVR